MTTDTERLDWLEKHAALLNVSYVGPHVCIDDGREGNYHVEASSYREVVDKAMREYVPFDPPNPEYPELTEIRFDRACFINGQHIPPGTVWKRQDQSSAAVDADQKEK